MAGSTSSVATHDPLVLLPSEIVLRIIEFTTLSGIASLTRLNRTWNGFIDETHQDAIYSSTSKTNHPQGAKDLSFVDSTMSFAKYYSDVSSWKDLCRRQTLLARNQAAEFPVTRESTVQIGNDPVWRFRPDFKRRIFLSTSQMGGLNVTDMDSGRLLWRLDAETVRPFAHLEYQDGTAVWDREGDAVEVWRADQDGLPRGQFKRIAVLPHNRQTRGFQLSRNTLCVVSSEGEGYVYDMSGTPSLHQTIEIPDGAVGHLDQGKDAVAYSLGLQGYHFYDKTTGVKLGVLEPKFCEDTYHIIHPKSQLDCRLGIGNLGRSADAFPPQYPGRDRTSPLEIMTGPLPCQPGGESTLLADDEWGAGMLNGDCFVGVSRGGRVFICSDWRAALKEPTVFAATTHIIECDSDGSTFDLGGWLSVRDHRVMFEIQDRVYVIGLDDNDHVIPSDAWPPKESPRKSFAFATSSAQQLSVPVSFMALYDDCIMSTYTTLRYRQRLEAAVQPQAVPQPRTRILPTKILRILSFAPCTSPYSNDSLIPLPGASAGTEQTGERREEATGAPREVNAMRADLYQLIAMLAGEPELEEDVEVEVGHGEEDDYDEEEAILRDFDAREGVHVDEDGNVWEDAEEGWGDGEGSDLD